MNTQGNWLLKLPLHRFNALKRSRLVKLKRLEAENDKGFLKSRAKIEFAYDAYTAIKRAEKVRNGQ